MIKTGIGIDIHKLKEGLPLFVGGVNIKASLGSVGHSDGDALIHAIVDALLGAAGMGDIGKYFPSGDKKWEDVQSKIFLSEVRQTLAKSKYQISNIDCTVVMQKPKLHEYISPICNNIAEILNIDKEKVSIKATTADYLGYIGKSKGWSALAIATIYNNDQDCSR